MRIPKLLTCTALLLLAGAAMQDERSFAQATSGTAQEAPSAQNRLVGEVQTANTAAGEFTIKTDDGRSVTLKTEARSSVLRIPPGETSTQSATKITLGDVVVGDRVFARGALSADGQSFSARQIVVANKQAVAQTQASQREDWQRRGVFGRIESINADKKEITIRTRGREGSAAQVVVVDASGKVKFMRNAPDSSRSQDAVASSFSELKVGDQLRARGERSSDGTRITAEEIVTSNVQRTGGTVQSVNAAANEIVVRNDQTGQTQTIVVSQRSLLRRITPEVAAQMAARRAEAGGGANGAGGAQRGQGNGSGARPAGQGAGGDGEQRRRAGGGGAGGRGGMQEMLQSLPAVAINDLKKGDVVIVTGSASGTDKSRLTAITLITGDADFLKRLMQLQGRPNRDGQNMSPGLPSDVVGGGSTNTTREQP
jgi:predicted transcriptional regulator